MTERITIINKQSLKLSAVIERPDGEGKFPLVILLHGYTGSMLEGHIETLGQDLPQAGISSIRFDASGCGESEGTWQDDYRMTNYLSDVDCIYEYVKTLDWVDSDRIGIWGHSMGGEMVVVWGAKHPELKATCVCQGPTAMDRVAWDRDFDLWKREGRSKDSELFGPIHIPAEFFIDCEKYSALDTAPRIKPPTLVIIGLEDDSVTPEDAMKVYDALDCEKVLLEVAEARHDYKNQPEILNDVSQKTVAFFKKYL